MSHRDLICNCRYCGCICAEHSPNGKENLCAAHVDRAIFRFVLDEARRLIVIGLFVAVVISWAGILTG